MIFKGIISETIFLKDLRFLCLKVPTNHHLGARGGEMQSASIGYRAD